MRRTLFVFVFALVLAGAISGQTGSSSQGDDKKVILRGTVYDRNGSVITGSHVVARSFAGKEYRAKTNSEGVYKIELPMDVYRIEVDAPGFCPARVRMFRVRKSLFEAPLDVVLEVAEGEPPCQQKTPVDKQPEKPERKIRKPEIFRSIAE